MRVGLGAAALFGPLLAFPTLRQPQLAIALCLAVVVTFLASRSIAFPLALWGLPGVLIAIIGSDPFPNNSVEYFLVGWVVLAILLTLLKEENALPLRLIVSGPMLMTLGLGIWMLARLGASSEPTYGGYKLQLFLAESVPFLVGGILLARSRRDTNLWIGLMLGTVALGSLVLLRDLVNGSAADVLPGRLALYAQAGPIGLARGAATGILLAIFVLLVSPFAWRRTAALALIPLLAIAFIGAGSRGPVVGLVAGLFVLLALSLGDRASRKRLLLVGAAVVASALIVPQLVPGQNVSRSLSVLVGGGKDAGGGDVSNGRTQLLSEAWTGFGNHPAAGIGTGGFATVDPVGIYPHNVFLEAADELGFPGLLLLGGTILLGFVHVGRAWRNSAGEDRQHAAIVGAFFAAAVVNAQFSGDLARNSAVWLGAGMALGLMQRAGPVSQDHTLSRLRQRWRRRGDGAAEPVAPGPGPLPPPRRSEQAPARSSAGGGLITAPAAGATVRGEVSVLCTPGSGGWTVGSVMVECAPEGGEWFEVGEAAVEQDYEVYVLSPGGGRRQVALLRSERRADQMRRALAGEHGVTADQIEIRPARRNRWSARETREARWESTRVEDGAYNLRAVTTDVTGRRIAGPELPVRVDNTAPSVTVDGPRRGAVLMGVVEVSATAKDEGSGVALVRFEASAGGDEWSELETCTDAPYRAGWNTGRLGEGDYLLRAIALDRAGNEAVSKTVPVRVERVAAAVRLDDPGEILSRTARLVATVRNEEKVTSVEFQVASADTFAWHAIGSVGQAPFELDFDTGRLADGLYDFRAVARDRRNGIDASRILRARLVDNTGPSVSLYEPIGGAVLRGEVPVSARATDEGSGVTSVLFQFSADDGRTWRPVVTRSDSPSAAFWDTQRVGDGEYLLRAVVGDGAGNLTASAPVPVRIDNTPPAVAIDDPKAGAVVSGTVRIRAAAADEGSGILAVRLEWSRDGAAWGELTSRAAEPYAYSWDTHAVPDDTYHLRAVARDRAGNSAFGDTVEVTVRNFIAYVGPEPPSPPAEPASVQVPAGPPVAAEEPEAEPEPDPFLAPAEAATLWQLERLLEERGAAVENREELEAILYTLRPYARPDGTIPERFWPLIWEAFGHLLEDR